MFRITTLTLGLGTALASASALNRRAMALDCLESASVPFDAEGSDDWEHDGAAFNLRIPYVPAAIAVPTSIEHIQAAVACASEAGLKVSAKCGGHSYANFGFGGEDGHLMLEMDRMHGVTLDKQTGVATIQGGSRLGHVAYEIFEKGNRAISHGTCPGVGVSGHSLHGGFGMSSHHKGLATDWMLEATVVLADGSVVTASEEENADLFWALRGAGSSMGIVAEYKFNTFEAPETVTYFTIAVPTWSTVEKSVAGIEAMQDFVVSGDMPSELTMRLFLTPNFVNFEGLLYGDEEALRNLLAPFAKKVGGQIVIAETVGWVDQIAHYGNGLELDQTHPYEMHQTFHSTSLYVDALSTERITDLVNYWFEVGMESDRDWYMHFDLHGGPTSAIAAVPEDKTSYTHRNKLYLINWYDRVDNSDEYPTDGYSLLTGWVKNITAGMEESEYGMYYNYPDTTLDRETAQKMYWGAALPKLREIKRMVDPEDMFYNPQSIEPAAAKDGDDDVVMPEPVGPSDPEPLKSGCIPRPSDPLLPEDPEP